MSKSSAPLLLVGGAALLIMSSKKKKKKKALEEKPCPPIVHLPHGLIVTEAVEVKYDDETTGKVIMPKAAYHEAVGGNHDIVDIAKKVLSPFIPASCVGSETIKIEFIDDEGHSRTFPAVEFFFLFAAEMVEDFYQAGLFSENEMKYSSNQMLKWWVDKMGDAPLPED